MPNEANGPHGVVIGYGNVGRLLASLLSVAGWEVTVADAVADREHLPTPQVGSGLATSVRHDTSPRFLLSTVDAPTAELGGVLARADVVILAVPERAALTAVDVLAAHTRTDTTVVDTLSHKDRYLEAANQQLAPRPLLSLNPLFHPSLGWAGNTVVASLVGDSAKARSVLALIAGTGARVHELKPADHDRCVTSVQAVTHAAALSFAHALTRLDLPPEDVIACAPPPTRMLMALASRILSADVETYWDIQSAGAPAEAARDALRTALADLSAQVSTEDENAFGTGFSELRDWYGAELGPFAADASRSLNTLITPAEESHTPEADRRQT